MSVLASILATLLLPCAPAAACEAGNHEQDRPVRSRLSSAAVIEGVPCDAWYVWHFPDGRLHECRLSRAASVRGASLPAKSVVVFERDGTFDYVFLPETTTVEGHRLRGHGHGWMTLFHAEGRLKLGWLAERETIDGIPCDKATFLGEALARRYAAIEFHPDGRLAACRLSRDVVVDGRRFEKGQRIRLDAEGRPRAFEGRPPDR